MSGNSKEVNSNAKKRRKLPEDSTESLIALVQSTSKDEDQYFHFGMNVAAKLRSLPPQKAAKAQMEISNMLYAIEYLED